MPDPNAPLLFSSLMPPLPDPSAPLHLPSDFVCQEYTYHPPHSLSLSVFSTHYVSRGQKTPPPPPPPQYLLQLDRLAGTSQREAFGDREGSIGYSNGDEPAAEVSSSDGTRKWLKGFTAEDILRDKSRLRQKLEVRF